jgi:hypothetical protein
LICAAAGPGPAAAPSSARRYGMTAWPLVRPAATEPRACPDTSCRVLSARWATALPRRGRRRAHLRADRLAGPLRPRRAKDRPDRPDPRRRGRRRVHGGATRARAGVPRNRHRSPGRTVPGIDHASQTNSASGTFLAGARIGLACPILIDREWRIGYIHRSFRSRAAGSATAPPRPRTELPSGDEPRPHGSPRGSRADALSWYEMTTRPQRLPPPTADPVGTPVGRHVW